MSDILDDTALVEFGREVADGDGDSLYQNPESLHNFQKLSLELKRMIYRYMFPTNRRVKIHDEHFWGYSDEEYSESGGTPETMLKFPAHPVTLHLDKEARQETLICYKMVEFKLDHSNYFLFNPERDTLQIDTIPFQQGCAPCFFADWEQFASSLKFLEVYATEYDQEWVDLGGGAERQTVVDPEMQKWPLLKYFVNLEVLALRVDDVTRESDRHAWYVEMWHSYEEIVLESRDANFCVPKIIMVEDADDYHGGMQHDFVRPDSDDDEGKDGDEDSDEGDDVEVDDAEEDEGDDGGDIEDTQDGDSVDDVEDEGSDVGQTEESEDDDGVDDEDHEDNDDDSE
ncbi:hypothetical protein VTL71DRAFT_15799 [Oculimacula yallundae]|uniref:2EXR domain-containing protein n=1 Tax=Oculimacula yallundae TaxID=86028 RepID=A0ABR4CF41_9HELO